MGSAASVQPSPSDEHVDADALPQSSPVKTEPDASANTQSNTDAEIDVNGENKQLLATKSAIQVFLADTQDFYDREQEYLSDIDSQPLASDSGDELDDNAAASSRNSEALTEPDNTPQPPSKPESVPVPNSRELIDMDPDPTNNREMLLYLQQIVRDCSLQAFENAVPAVNDLGDAATAVRRAFRREKCTDLPVQDPNASELELPPEHESFLDDLVTDEDFEAYNIKHGELPLRPIDYLKRMKAARQERFRILREAAQQKEWRALGRLKNVKRYLFTFPDVRSVAGVIADLIDLVQWRKRSQLQLAEAEALRKKLSEEAMKADRQHAEAESRVKPSEVEHNLESGTSFLVHKGYQIEVPDTEVLDATFQAAAADAAAKAAAAKAAQDAARKADRAADAAYFAAAKVHNAVEADEAGKVVKNAAPGVQFAKAAAVNAAKAQDLARKTSRVLYHPPEQLMTQSRTELNWTSRVDAVARKLFREAAVRAGSQRFARSDSERRKEFILHHVAYAAADLMKHVKRESSRKGLTTSAQMLWAVQNDAIRTFEVDRLAAVERLNTTFEFPGTVPLEIKFSEGDVVSQALPLMKPCAIVTGFLSNSGSLPKAGIQIGDALMSVNDQHFTNEDELHAIAAQSALLKLKVVRLAEIPIVSEMQDRAIDNLLADARVVIEQKALGQWAKDHNYAQDPTNEPKVKGSSKNGPSSLDIDLVALGAVAVTEETDALTSPDGNIAEQSKDSARSSSGDLSPAIVRSAASESPCGEHDVALLEAVASYDLDKLLHVVLDPDVFAHSCRPEVQILAVLALDVLSTMQSLCFALESGGRHGHNTLVQNIRVRMANLMELSNTQRNIIPADQHRPAKLIQPPLHQHHPELAQTTSGSGIAATEEWPEGTMPTAGDQDPTANGEPTLHVRRGLAMARHGVGLEGADAASFPSSNLTYNKDGERLLVPRVGGHELGQLRLELLQQRLGSGSNALLTGPLDNNNLPELRIDGHLVQVIADLIHRLQSSTNKVYIALRANNETEAGDDPVARAQLVEALALLQQCRNPLLYVDKFLRDCEQPILQELANALSAAASHSRATLEATPLLLDAAAAMQSCARRLRTERLTVATRNFLQNARLQFASCCQARDWELLGGLVQIYKLLRFSATGAGFNSDQDKAKISKVQAHWRGRKARRKLRLARYERQAEDLHNLFQEADRDQNGVLDNSELLLLASSFANRATGGCAPVSAARLTKTIVDLFSSTRAVADGKVTKREFVSIYRALVAPVIEGTQPSSWAGALRSPRSRLRSARNGRSSFKAGSAQSTPRSVGNSPRSVESDTAGNANGQRDNVERLRQFFSMIQSQDIVKLPKLSVGSVGSPKGGDGIRRGLSRSALVDEDNVDDAALLQLRQSIAWVASKTRSLLRRALDKFDVPQIQEILNFCEEATATDQAGISLEGSRFLAQRAIDIANELSSMDQLAKRWTPSAFVHARTSRQSVMASWMQSTARSSGTIASTERRLGRRRNPLPPIPLTVKANVLLPEPEQEALLKPHIETLRALVDDPHATYDFNFRPLTSTEQLCSLLQQFWGIRDVVLADFDHDPNAARSRQSNIGRWLLAGQSGTFAAAVSGIDNFARESVFGATHFPHLFGFIRACRLKCQQLLAAISLEKRLRVAVDSTTCDFDHLLGLCNSIDANEEIANILDPGTVDLARKRLAIFQRIKHNIESLTSGIDATHSHPVDDNDPGWSIIEKLRPLDVANVARQVRRAAKAGLCDKVVAFARRCLIRHAYHTKAIAAALSANPHDVDYHVLSRIRWAAALSGCIHPALSALESLTRVRRIIKHQYLKCRKFVPHKYARRLRECISTAQEWTQRHSSRTADGSAPISNGVNSRMAQILVQECQLLSVALRDEQLELSFVQLATPRAAGFASSLAARKHSRGLIGYRANAVLYEHLLRQIELIVAEALRLGDWPLLFSLREGMETLRSAFGDRRLRAALGTDIQQYLDQLRSVTLHDVQPLPKKKGANQNNHVDASTAALFSPLTYHVHSAAIVDQEPQATSSNQTDSATPRSMTSFNKFTVVIDAALLRQPLTHSPQKQSTTDEQGRAPAPTGSVKPQLDSESDSVDEDIDQDSFDSWETGNLLQANAQTKSDDIDEEASVASTESSGSFSSVYKQPNFASLIESANKAAATSEDADSVHDEITQLSSPHLNNEAEPASAGELVQDSLRLDLKQTNIAAPNSNRQSPRPTARDNKHTTSAPKPSKYEAPFSPECTDLKPPAGKRCSVTLHTYLVRNKIKAVPGAVPAVDRSPKENVVDPRSSSDEDAQDGNSSPTASILVGQAAAVSLRTQDQLQSHPLVLPDFEVLASCSCTLSSGAAATGRMNLLAQEAVLSVPQSEDMDNRPVFAIVHIGHPDYTMQHSAYDNQEKPFAPRFAVAVRVRVVAASAAPLCLRKVSTPWRYHARWTGHATGSACGGPRIVTRSKSRKRASDSKYKGGHVSTRLSTPRTGEQGKGHSRVVRESPRPRKRRKMVSKTWFENPQLRLCVLSEFGPRVVHVAIVQRLRVKVRQGSKARRHGKRGVESPVPGLTSSPGRSISIAAEDGSSSASLVRGGSSGKGSGLTICVNKPTLKFGTATAIAAHAVSQYFDIIYESQPSDGITKTTVTTTRVATGAHSKVLRDIRDRKHSGGASGERVDVVEEREICTILSIPTRKHEGQDDSSRSTLFAGCRLFPLFVVPHARAGVSFDFDVQVYASEDLGLAEVKLLDRDLNSTCHEYFVHGQS